MTQIKGHFVTYCKLWSKKISASSWWGRPDGSGGEGGGGAPSTRPPARRPAPEEVETEEAEEAAEEDRRWSALGGGGPRRGAMDAWAPDAEAALLWSSGVERREPGAAERAARCSCAGLMREWCTQYALTLLELLAPSSSSSSSSGHHPGLEEPPQSPKGAGVHQGAAVADGGAAWGAVRSPRRGKSIPMGVPPLPHMMLAR